MCADNKETDKTSDSSAHLSVSHLLLINPYLLLLPVVIPHFDSKNNHTTCTGNEVSQYQIVVFYKETLDNKGSTTDCHRNKARQRDAVSITCTDGLNGLWQIAKDKAKSGYPAANINQKLMFHSNIFLVIRGKDMKKNGNNDVFLVFFYQK